MHCPVGFWFPICYPDPKRSFGLIWTTEQIHTEKAKWEGSAGATQIKCSSGKQSEIMSWSSPMLVVSGWLVIYWGRRCWSYFCHKCREWCKASSIHPDQLLHVERERNGKQITRKASQIKKNGRCFYCLFVKGFLCLLCNNGYSNTARKWNTFIIGTLTSLKLCCNVQFNPLVISVLGRNLFAEFPAICRNIMSFFSNVTQ